MAKFKKWADGTVTREDDMFVDAQGRLKSGSDPWNASASGHGYNSRWSDDQGYKRGEQSRGGAQAWESRGADDAEFLRPSQSRTDDGTSQDILNEVLDHSGAAGPMLTGGGPVRQIGGGSSPPRYKSNAGRKDNDNDGL
jgi:hypothetical protein